MFNLIDWNLLKSSKYSPQNILSVESHAKIYTRIVRHDSALWWTRALLQMLHDPRSHIVSTWNWIIALVRVCALLCSNTVFNFYRNLQKSGYLFVWSVQIQKSGCRINIMASGAMLTMPMLLINMGGEMLYVLDQRLKAQNIPDDKSTKGICCINSEHVFVLDVLS